MTATGVGGVRFVLAAMALFAIQDAISTHLAARYPVPFFVMIRYWFFAAFVLVVAGRRAGGLRAASKTRMPMVQSLRGVLLAVQILVIVTAYDRIGLGETQAIFALHPLVATLLAITVLGERVGWRRLAAIGIGFAGMLVILRPGVAVFDPQALIAVLAAGMMAAYSVMTRMVNEADGSSGPSFFYTGVAGAAVLSLIGPFFWTAMAPADLGWLAILSVAGMTGHYCLIRAYEEAEASRIQPFVYLQMVFGVALGWAIFGERVDGWMLLGGAMIIGAGLYAIWRERVAARRAMVSGAP